MNREVLNGHAGASLKVCLGSGEYGAGGGGGGALQVWFAEVENS